MTKPSLQVIRPNRPKKEVLTIAKKSKATRKRVRSVLPKIVIPTTVSGTTVSTGTGTAVTTTTTVTSVVAPKLKGNKKSLRDAGKTALFITLAKPNKDGVSRWVSADEWVGEYAPLALGNGLSWGRKGSTLDSMFFIEKDRSQTKGNSIDAIRLNGYKQV